MEKLGKDQILSVYWRGRNARIEIGGHSRVYLPGLA
jgi:hypothetical protein